MKSLKMPESLRRVLDMREAARQDGKNMFHTIHKVNQATLVCAYQDYLARANGKTERMMLFAQAFVAEGLQALNGREREG